MEFGSLELMAAMMVNTIVFAEVPKIFATLCAFFFGSVSFDKISHYLAGPSVSTAKIHT